MDYEQFKIYSFDLWDLYLHKEQYPYIGRCYAVSRNPKAENALDISHDESKDLFLEVIPEWFDAVKILYKADWPNVAILGNDWRHLHAHLIPRYFSPRILYGVEFKDPSPAKNYSPYPKKDLSLEFLMKIKDDIRKRLESASCGI